MSSRSMSSGLPAKLTVAGYELLHFLHVNCSSILCIGRESTCPDIEVSAGRSALPKVFEGIGRSEGRAGTAGAGEEIWGRAERIRE